MSFLPDGGESANVVSVRPLGRASGNGESGPLRANGIGGGALISDACRVSS